MVNAPTRPGWLSDFAWSDGRLVIRKTGVRLKLDRAVLAEIWSWTQWLAIMAVGVPLARAGRPRPRMRLWYAPDVPRPWYMLRSAALWNGLELAGTPDEADAWIYFDDATVGEPPAPPPGVPALNFACADVTKSRVAAVFEEVFGYPLALDPTRASGPIVEKPEKNGVHGGRVVQAPVVPRPGWVYQRLVVTGDGRAALDLRTPCVGGRPVMVWLKQKPAGDSFAIHSLRTRVAEPETVYSAEELALISRFCARMGLDWGGLDILRDRHDGRLYIVDVNKTDLGPVISLGWADKVRSMKRLGRALEALVLARAAVPAAPAERSRDAA